jgi:hypothetical protein
MPFIKVPKFLAPTAGKKIADPDADCASYRPGWLRIFSLALSTT